MNGLDPFPHPKIANAPPDSKVGCPVCKTNFAAKDGISFWLTGTPKTNTASGNEKLATSALFAAGRTPSGLKRGRCAENRFGKSASLPVAIWRLGRPRSILSPTL